MNALVLAIFDSPLDIGVVVLIVLLLFGSSQLPKLARSLGSAQKEFRKGIEEGAEGSQPDQPVKHLPSAPLRAPGSGDTTGGTHREDAGSVQAAAEAIHTENHEKPGI